MLEGLWSLEFATKNDADKVFRGAGVVVLENQKLFGGDSGYYYLGDYQIENGNVNAIIKVTRYASEAFSVLGPVENLTLQVVGKLHKKIMLAEAFLTEDYTKNLFIRFTKRAELT